MEEREHLPVCGGPPSTFHFTVYYQREKVVRAIILQPGFVTSTPTLRIIPAAAVPIGDKLRFLKHVFLHCNMEASHKNTTSKEDLGVCSTDK
jgi:hypothetical protein